MNRSRSGGLAALVAALAGVVFVSSAYAHFSTRQYTHATSAGVCASLAVDPIQIVFTGSATVGNVRTHVTNHTGWTNQGGGSQLFPTHLNPTVCIANGSTEQWADGDTNVDRFHVRFKQTYDSSPTYGTTSIATPHYEVYDFPCGHRVQTSPNGFVRARTTLYNAMINGGHQFVVTGFWANDNAIKQCNGTYVGSDGFVTYIDI